MISEELIRNTFEHLCGRRVYYQRMTDKKLLFFHSITGKERNKERFYSFLIYYVAPYSPVVHPRFGETYFLHLHRRRRISQARETRKKEAASRVLLVAFLTLKIKATYSSETSVGFQRTTLRSFPESVTFHNNRCENLAF
jgi:hypothetical protein